MVGNHDVEAVVDVTIGAELAGVQLDVVVGCFIASCSASMRQSLKQAAKPMLG